MNLHTQSLREAVETLDAQLRQLLTHPEATQQDKASVILTRNQLLEIQRRHMGRFTPCNPATLPPRNPGQKYAEVPDWRRDWENEMEVANA